MTAKIKMYAHPYCPSVPAVTSILKGAKVDYDYINIHEDDEARELVRQINRGYESVPTLVFEDGSTLTEPSTGELKAKLQDMGYSVPLKNLMLAYLPRIAIGAVILYSMLRFMEVI